MEELFQPLVGEALNHVPSVSLTDTGVNQRQLCAGGMDITAHSRARPGGVERDAIWPILPPARTASADDLQPTSAPAPVRGIDRQAIGARPPLPELPQRAL